MNTPQLPPNDSERLAALARYNILDTSPDAAFDEVSRLAAQICQTPMAMISFVDRDRIWIKSQVGWEITEIPRELSLCSQAILEDTLFQVENTLEDPRCADNPFVTGPPHLRFYAAVPLRTGDGFKLGTLCVLSPKSQRLEPHQSDALAILARQVMGQLELRRVLSELARTIDENKITTQRLKDSDAFYQALVESLPQNIIRKDSDGRFTFANNKFCQSIGRTIDDMLGKTDFDMFPNELASKYHRDDLRVMATKENLDTVEAHQTPHGDKSFVHVIKTPLYDSHKRVIGIQGIFWDVTHRKRIEEALAYERDLLRALLDNIPDRIYFKDVHSRFLRCSTSMVRRLGLEDPKEVVGKTDFDFHSRAEAQEYYNDEQRIILTGKPLINKLERQSSTDDEEIWASVTKVPIYNQAGAVTGIIGISRDVTQLKQTEMELEKARDSALESARIKSQFLANMSHEIRTPMNAITGMTGLLQDTPLDPEQREYVDTIGHSTATLLAIINEILDYSKIEAGKVTLENIRFALRETVESTAKMLAETAQRKGLELASWIDPSLPDILLGDPGRFRQVLANLLSNAVKFTQSGEVLVHVTCHQDSPDRIHLLFTVKDSGIGIEKEALSQIFEPFTQADGSTTRKYGGTGLGLTITSQLVELMEGHLEVVSQPGQGSTFSFQVPFIKHLSSPAADEEASAIRSVLAEKRILILDDSSLTRKILLDLLNFWNTSAEAVATVEEGLDCLQKAGSEGCPFDLLLYDFELPGESGLNLATKFRTVASHLPLRMVAMTTYACQVRLDEMREAGIAERLIKPVACGSLRRCLVRALQDKRPDETITSEDSATPETARILTNQRSGAVSDSPTAVYPVRVLLAEDNKVNQRVALSQLKKLGFTADAVTNGAMILEAMQKKAYDIILMDCQMPEMDGYEATRHLRQARSASLDDPLSTPYIIALTANTLEGDRQRCLDAGMNDYLTKPIDMNRLEEVLHRALNHLNIDASPIPVAKDFSESTKQSSANPELSEADLAPVLDPSIIQSLRQLQSEQDPNPLQGLMELYINDVTPKLSGMEEALEAQNSSQLAAVAHSLKGSSNNLGAKRLALLCGSLEMDAKSDELTSASSLLHKIKTEFELVKEALKRELD